MQNRSLTLAGAVNLRDFGGYATADGHQVKRHRLYRSGTLAHLSDDAQKAFADLGIGLICDLRHPDEREEEPTALPQDQPRRLEIPIFPGSGAAMRDKLTRGEVKLTERIDFTALLDLEDGGFLVHCSAGKDRTGFACALILHALGVPEDVVLEDYLLTNELMDYEGFVVPRMVARYESAVLPDREAIMALAGVRPEYLKAAYEAIEAEFEGVEHYLERAIGLDAAARQRLRAQLVT
jgi:protein-tyrosine phosphatase